MKIVPVTVEHIELVVPLFDAYRIFYRQDSDVDSCRNFLNEILSGLKNQMFLALSDDEKPIGFTNLYPLYSSVGMSRVFLLNDLYVDSDFRQKGVGAELLNHAASWAKTQGAIRLHLETEISNDKAQSLYEGLGWLKEKTSFFYYLPLT